MEFRILLFIASCFIHNCLASMEDGPTKLHFEAKGGEVNVKAMDSHFSFRLHGLRELKEDGMPVIMNASALQKHAFDMFKEQHFTLGDVTTVNSSSGSPSYMKRDMETKVALGNNANVTVTLGGLIFKTNETIDFMPKIKGIVPGKVCAEVEIKGWKFCDSSNLCKNGSVSEIGKFLEAKFEVMATPIGAVSIVGMNVTMGPAFVTVSNEFKIDSESFAVLDPLPKVEAVDNKAHLTIRIPKFSIGAKYGFVCVTVDPKSTSGATALAAGVTTFIALVSAMFLN